jgi:hypothetical protein
VTPTTKTIEIAPLMLEMILSAAGCRRQPESDSEHTTSPDAR